MSSFTYLRSHVILVPYFMAPFTVGKGKVGAVRCVLEFRDNPPASVGRTPWFGSVLSCDWLHRRDLGVPARDRGC